MTDNNEALQALEKVGYWYERGCEDLALECEEKVRKALQADQVVDISTCSVSEWNSLRHDVEQLLFYVQGNDRLVDKRTDRLIERVCYELIEHAKLKDSQTPKEKGG